MLTYSVAIRTLGTAGEKFREELSSIAGQTVQPDRVLVYIAEGYDRPAYTVGREEYVWVKKGMVAQRVLPYDEISSEVILMLDDDVRLAPDSAERMLAALETYGADAVGADTFKNQEMSVAAKMYAAITNLVFPHWDRKWAFKIHRNGSFSYQNAPVRSFCWSQSCAGNAAMWRMTVYRQLHLEDEMWLDELPFAYNDDTVEFYKLHKNGFRLGVLYDSGCEHLDGQSSSLGFRKGSEWIQTRTMALFVIWWRTIFQPTRKFSVERWLAIACFVLKVFWLFFVLCGGSIVRCSVQPVISYVKGLHAGWQFVHTERFRSLGSFVLR